MAHDQEIVGSNPGTVYWMDVSDASYYIVEILKNKGSQMGHTKKIFKKKNIKLRILSNKSEKNIVSGHL
jgi:hypothetical protein